MIFSRSLRQLILITAFFYSGCSLQPVELHPSHQAPAPRPLKITPVKKITEPIIVSAPNPPIAKAPPVTTSLAPVEVKIASKVSSPELLTKNINNISAANNIIENSLNLNELEAAAADSTLNAFKPQLLLKIGKIYQKNKEIEKASEYFRSLTTLFPQSVYATQATILLASLQSSSEVDANVIGAILPLTGKNASIGQHALNAIRLGLELNKNEKKFRIALFDSQSDADLAAKGVDKLVSEDKAVVVLGGFSAREASSIATRAELLSIPFIGFSQKPGLTNVGEYVFRNALTPEMQVERLVGYATEKLAAKKFAILYPNDSYGVEFSNVFWDHVLARGGQITAAQSYDPKATDFSEAIQKMVGLFYEEARAEELKQRIKDIRNSAKKKEKANKDKPVVVKNQRDSYSENTILQPIVDFDVLFVPDSSRALGQVLAFMKFNDVTDMNYLGTNLWNSADLPKRAAGEDAGIFFVDAIDTTDLSTKESSFFKDYFATYNEEPTLVEIQAFEAAKIVNEQISAGANGREALAAALRGLGTSSVRVTGELKMTSQRELVRPVHVLMLDSGVVKKVD